MMPHRCNEKCVCPVDGKPLYYAIGTGEHACFDPDCVNAYGMTPDFPSSWTIAVCRTCGRQAVWPFCDHREMNGEWFTYVTVRGRVPESERRPQVGKHRSDAPSITCPDCGATSFHPEDIRQGYCGRCKEFTSGWPNSPLGGTRA